MPSWKGVAQSPVERELSVRHSCGKLSFGEELEVSMRRLYMCYTYRKL
jgi:hypothetical protein